MRIKPTLNMAALFTATTLLAPSALHAQDEVSDEVIAFWAKHAMPLKEFVAQGYGMSKPGDASSPEWCAYQPITISLLYADSTTCERLLTRIEAIGRTPPGN